jgi:heme-degrading monooxygenase HmoA
MIARIWRGATEAAQADAYLAYLEKTGVEEIRATPGNSGVRLLRRIVGERAEFVFISFWDSLESIRAFAGPDIERAIYFPEDTAFLLELEPTVAHYEVFNYE